MGTRWTKLVYIVTKVTAGTMDIEIRWKLSRSWTRQKKPRSARTQKSPLRPEVL